jgi:KTSC domain
MSRKPNYPWSVAENKRVVGPLTHTSDRWRLGPKVEYKGKSRKALENTQSFARKQQASGLHKYRKIGGRISDYRTFEVEGQAAGFDVSSTAVKNIWWEDSEQFLANGGRRVGTVKIQYHSGTTIYDFPNVPWQEYLRLVNAPSIGHYLYIYFRPKFSVA